MNTAISGNPGKYADVAKALGVDDSGKTDEEVAMEGIAVIKGLCRELGDNLNSVPSKLSTRRISSTSLRRRQNTSAIHRILWNSRKKQYMEIFDRVYNAD